MTSSSPSSSSSPIISSTAHPSFIHHHQSLSSSPLPSHFKQLTLRTFVYFLLALVHCCFCWSSNNLAMASYKQQTDVAKTGPAPDVDAEMASSYSSYSDSESSSPLVGTGLAPVESDLQKSESKGSTGPAPDMADAVAQDRQKAQKKTTRNQRHRAAVKRKRTEPVSQPADAPLPLWWPWV